MNVLCHSRLSPCLRVTVCLRDILNEVIFTRISILLLYVQCAYKKSGFSIDRISAAAFVFVYLFRGEIGLFDHDDSDFEQLDLVRLFIFQSFIEIEIIKSFIESSPSGRWWWWFSPSGRLASQDSRNPLNLPQPKLIFLFRISHTKSRK